jgi:flavin-dependent dehydrogenase
MLLNLSNHPFKTWPAVQQEAAKRQFNEIEDLPFPRISPSVDTDEIKKLVEEYETQVRKYDPAAVHIMGELTFCHALINQLQKAGIPCIASTTKREVHEKANGEIARTFEFVRFRSYLQN